MLLKVRKLMFKTGNALVIIINEKDIIDSLQWLGLKWDEGPFRQSQRTASYAKYLEKLIKEGTAYYCFCFQFLHCPLLDVTPC